MLYFSTYNAAINSGFFMKLRKSFPTLFVWQITVTLYTRSNEQLHTGVTHTSETDLELEGVAMLPTERNGKSIATIHLVRKTRRRKSSLVKKEAKYIKTKGSVEMEATKFEKEFGTEIYCWHLIRLLYSIKTKIPECINSHVFNMSKSSQISWFTCLPRRSLAWEPAWMRYLVCDMTMLKECERMAWLVRQ